MVQNIDHHLFYLNTSNIRIRRASVPDRSEFHNCLNFSALVAVLKAISGFMRFGEKWINYRGYSERLKREKYLFETATSPNDKENALKLLVLKTENIISSVNADWGEYIRHSEDKET